MGKLCQISVVACQPRLTFMVMVPGGMVFAAYDFKLYQWNTQRISRSIIANLARALRA